MSIEAPTVYVVDDDQAVRESLEFMFKGAEFPVETFKSAEQFLKSYKPTIRGCLILDLRMPGMGGSQLHDELTRGRVGLPVIILTGHGDIPSAVDRIKAGAFDFLSKPVNRDVLLARVNAAIEAFDALSSRRRETQSLEDRINQLSPREVEVMDRIAAGQSSKFIALERGVAYRTITHHRDHVMKKMQAENAADLVRMLGIIGRIGKILPAK